MNPKRRRTPKDSEDSEAITLDSDEKALIFCGKVDNHGRIGKHENWKFELECKSGSLFTYRGYGEPVDIDIYKLGELIGDHEPLCAQFLSHTSRAVLNSKTDTETSFEIGFTSVILKSFTKQISISFDKTSMIPKYAEHSLTSFIDTKETNSQFHHWVDDEIYSANNINPNKLYDINHQEMVINKKLEKTYVIVNQANPIDDIYLQRGQLAPWDDFVYPAQESATFYDINSAPQWNTIANGSWKAIENKVRQHAQYFWHPELKIITGVCDVLTLSDYKNVPKEIYLKDEREKRFPVPKYFYKIVEYKPEEPLVFVVLNNPYYHNDKNHEDIFCDDISEHYYQEDWLLGSTWKENRTTVKEGYWWMCNFKQVQKKCGLPDLPALLGETVFDLET